MNKIKDSKILKFPTNITEAEKQIEAILFAAEEPLDQESIQEKLKTRTDISKILDSLEKQYQYRGINLICISKKWSFRTATNLSKFKKSTQLKKSALCALFSGSLELAREGVISIMQKKTFDKFLIKEKK